MTTGSRPVGLTIAAGVAFVWMLPLLYLGQVSLSRGGLDNYATVLSTQGLGRYVLNSAIVTICAIVIVVVFGSAAAFAFSLLRFRGRTAIYVLLLSGLMLPTAAVLVPLTQIHSLLGWANTYQGLFVPYAALALPFGLVLLKNTYDALPHELHEAAAVDGASHARVFWQVFFPLTIPTVIMVALWTFLSSWNEFLLALMFMATDDMKTVTVVPTSFQLQFFVDVPKIFASLVLIQLPIIALYALMQRRFERGIVAGAVK
ncbi:carbohydrate ABC transporter permease [Phytoactinopolyspora alkaliphila]|uniref:Carbohydrate ABC transporter permease n=1 Tax=Phytoactinopolyspora alkaliphila TaxID=1783498 RepID=A0A6N9YS91_9ACTN|nr:carbohydrate ABC transporter permease [Phytoactinopolyspora alkaliphila]NED97852.1 carbohydrate ABC transporter permease [Phytoactinopolyspora alkaliphila]